MILWDVRSPAWLALVDKGQRILDQRKAEAADGRAFWVVWQPEDRSPTMRHETKQSAITEAERLARQHTGRRFYVLEAERFIVKDDLHHIILSAGQVFDDHSR